MKILLILIFSSLLLMASSDNKYQVRIIEKIFNEISIDKELKIWSDNKSIQKTLKENNNFSTVKNIEDANIVILRYAAEANNISSNQFIFVLNYKLLSTVPRSFGALFWKKGRPNIVIIEPRIALQNISISKDLEPYLEEKVW